MLINQNKVKKESYKTKFEKKNLKSQANLVEISEKVSDTFEELALMKRLKSDVQDVYKEVACTPSKVFDEPEL
jgi:uncharacterized membrane-anchored protein YhcB (DUF1043 family)